MSKIFENKFKIKYDWFIHSLELLNSKPQSTGIISSRLRKLEGYYILLTEAYESILNVCTEVADAALIKEYDIKFREATEIYNMLECSTATAARPALDDTKAPTETAPLPRLPRIDLTTFNGDIYSWASFISLFNSLVLSRNDISKTEKFHYLFSHVEGEPRILIQHLAMVDESLDSALEILRARFDNKRLLTDSHISRILYLPVIDRSLELRTKILNPLLESTRALNNLGLPTNEWSYMLVYIGLTKLPLEIKTRFEQQYGGNNDCLPTFDQLLQFLQNECRLIDTAASASVQTVVYAERLRRTDKRNVHLIQNDSGNQSGINHKQCCYCHNSGHTVRDCFKFGDLLEHDRKHFIQVNGLCYKCFGRHSATSCRRYVPCGRCGNTGHNELICTFIARSAAPIDRAQRTQHAYVSACDNVVSGRQSPCDPQRGAGVSRGYFDRRGSTSARAAHSSECYQRRASTDDAEKGNSSQTYNERVNRAASPAQAVDRRHNCLE